MASQKNTFDGLFDKIRSRLRSDGVYNELVLYLDKIKRNPEANPFGSKEFLSELVEQIIYGRQSSRSAINGSKSFGEILSDCEKIFPTVVPFNEKEEGYPAACAVFLKLFDKDGIYFNGAFSAPMFLCFSDKRLYIEIMTAVLEIGAIIARMDKVVEYAVGVRQFYADERAFGASVVSTAMRLHNAENTDFVIKEQTELAKKAAGIYAIDEKTLSTAAEQLKTTERMLEETRRNLELTANRARSFTELADNCQKELKSIALAETKNLRLEASNAGIDMKKAYTEVLNEERQSLEYDKDKFLSEIFDSADSKIRELKMVSESVRNSAAKELYRINNEANKAVDRAAAMLDSDELKNIIAELRRDDELIEKIVRVEAFSRKFDEEEPPVPKAAPAPVTVPVTVAAEQVSPVFSAAVPADMEKPVDMTVNFYFNESIPFWERISQLREKKLRDEENGSLYHSRFDDILVALIEDANPYLIGPSGCGKTYLIGQLSSLLGIECLDIGYINEEYDILGFQTASGGYNYPAFYRAYKYGAIVFCDEFDNSNSRAAVKLNSFMANGKNASYCFPNGERVMRHPNFRIIAAGNTSGSGADRNYSTREKIEESVQQRFTAMYVGYDNRLEKQILSDYPEWFEFAESFRRATDSWSRANDTAASGIFTTRDAANIKKYLDHESFSDAAIIDYEFIETKDNEYLAFLQKEMSEYYNKGARISRKLFDIFDARVGQLRKNGGIR